MNLLTGFFTVDSTEMASTTFAWAGYTFDSIKLFVFVIVAVLLVAIVIKMIVGALH